MLELQDISLSFKSDKEIKTVFRNLNCRIPTDRRFIVLGAHSSGKTTLIGLLSGSIVADNGSVVREADVSFPVGSGGGFRSKLTVRQNIMHVASLYEADCEE